MACPTSKPSPCSRYQHAGQQACLREGTRPAQRGEGRLEAGLPHRLLPVTSAGPIFQAAIDIGKFQGVINPTLPIGLRVV